MRKHTIIILFLSAGCLVLHTQHPKLIWKKAHTVEILTPPLILQDQMIMADRNGSLMALTRTGKRLWTVKIREGCYAPPVSLKKGPIYLTTNKHLYAVSSKGKIEWKIRLQSPVRTSPIIFENNIYIFSINGAYACYNSRGKKKWQKKFKKQILTTPRCDSSGNIYVPTHEYTLYKISHQGNIKWRFKTPGVLRSTPTLYSRTLLLQTSMDHRLYALNRESGRLAWTFKAGYWILSSPAVDTEGTIFFGSYDKHFYAVSINGKLKWKIPLKASSRVSPTQNDAGALFTADDSGTIYQINPQGAIEWQYKTEDSIYSPVALLGMEEKKLIIAANISGYLYCFTSNNIENR